MAKTYPKGIFYNKPREGAPEFVRGSISIKVDEAIQFLQEYKNDKGYVNLDMLLNKENGIYLVLNEYGLKKQENVQPRAVSSESGLSPEDKAILDQARQIEIDAKAKGEITDDEFFNSI